MNISVVVCTYNRCDSLRDTLRALGRQALRPSQAMEIVVVDNNSGDRTRAVVEECARESRHPVRYVFEPRQGLNHARNRGAREAQGAIVAYTDDDVVPDERWAAALWEAFERHQADCVGGRILPLWLAPPPDWLTSERLRMIAVWLDHGDQARTAGRDEATMLFGANIAFRKSIFGEIGPFDVALGPRGEGLLRADETEMIQRLLDAGKRVVYTPDALVHHKVFPERLEMPYLRRWHYNTGRSFVMIRAESAPLPRWLVRECAANGLQALRSYCRRQRQAAVERELVFWAQLGQVVETLRRRWKPWREHAGQPDHAGSRGNGAAVGDGHAQRRGDTR